MTRGQTALLIWAAASLELAAQARHAAAQPSPGATSAADPAAPKTAPNAPANAVRAAAPAPAILSFTVNGAVRGDIYVYLDEETAATPRDVYVRSDDLRAANLGEVMGARHLFEGVEYVSLRSMSPPARFSLDEKEMTLALEVPPELFPTTQLELGVSTAPEDMELGSNASAFLNYAINASTSADRNGYDGYFEAGTSRGPWLLYSSAILNDQHRVRGLSNLSYDDRDQLRRFVVGDAVTAGDALGGSALMGGVQLARSFELDPYRVFRPTLGQTGIARAPSTAEIYVNGVLVRRAELPPGPFSTNDLPVTTGAGTTRVVVRDALGNEQTYEASYYLPVNLLAPGISEYSYTLGYHRREVGTESWGYDTAALVATHRLGLTSWLTAGFRAEAGWHLASGGPNVVLGLPVGEVSLALAASRTREESGAAASLGYTYSGRRFTVGLLGRGLSDGYATTALAAKDDRTRLELGASLSLPVGAAMSVTAQATRQTSRDRGTNERASLSTSLSLSNAWQLSLSAGLGREMDGPAQIAVFASLTMLLSGRTTAMASQRTERAVRSVRDETGEPNSSGETAVELQRTLPVDTGYGYRLRGQLAQSGRERGEARIDLQGQHGQLTGEATWDGEQATGRAGVAGGVVLIGGRVFATRPVQRGYALIRVPGSPGVRGYLDNHLVGKTDARGDLVVPNLIPYYANRISIDDSDLPLDTSAEITERLIASRTRGGVVVKFAPERLRAVRGSIVIDDGRTSAAYGELHVKTKGGHDERSPVGTSGEFELANLPPGKHRAQLEYDGGSCEIALSVPERGQPVEELGRLPCLQPVEARR